MSQRIPYTDLAPKIADAFDRALKGSADADYVSAFRGAAFAATFKWLDGQNLLTGTLDPDEIPLNDELLILIVREHERTRCGHRTERLDIPSDAAGIAIAAKVAYLADLTLWFALQRYNECRGDDLKVTHHSP